MTADPLLVDDWHPVLRADAVGATPVGVRLLGEDVVVWRANGDIRAFQDLCVHRGAKLSLGRVDCGTLVCPYHGWTYDGAGQCVRFPAHPEMTPAPRARVKTYLATERYGLVWVCLGTPSRDVFDFPEEDDPSYRRVLSGPFPRINAFGTRLIENFLDVAHFPFVHAGILGDPGRPEMTDYEVETGPDGIVAANVLVYQPDPYGTGVGDDVAYTYRVFRPLAAYLKKQSDDGTRFSLMLLVTPNEAGVVTPWFYMAVNRDNPLPDEELGAFHGSILAQDVPIVESQRPELLPLDLQVEFHLRSDRLTIAYRRWLMQLGVTYGTALLPRAPATGRPFRGQEN
jgi:phenylpropionate dioxygenase-like ring-hydroxylating dioxygenase large terminal subunit